MKDKQNYNAYMKKYMLNRYHERRSKTIVSLGSKCIDCGSIDNLEIDHKDHLAKTLDIAKLWSVAESRYLEEIGKCTLRCKPCHIDKTIRERGKLPAKGTHGTLSSYRYCKCDECKSANAKWNREYKRKRKNKGSCPERPNGPGF